MTWPSNQPVSQRERVKARVESLEETAKAWEKLESLPDAVVAGRCEDFLTQLRHEATAIEMQRSDERKPYYDELLLIQGFYIPLLDRLTAAGEACRRLKANWLERLGGDRPQVASGITGKRSGFRMVWSARITDPRAALLHYADHPKLRMALQEIADADARKHKTGLVVPGVEIKSERQVS